MPGSTSRSIRSRAVSFPRERWRSTDFSPPPRATCDVRSRNSATRASIRSARRANVSSRSTCEVRTAMQLSLTNAPADADKPVVRRDSFMFLLVGGGFMAIVPPALIHFVSPEQVMLSSKTHFWAVVALVLRRDGGRRCALLRRMAARRRARGPRRDGLHGDGLFAARARSRKPGLHRRDERCRLADRRCDAAGGRSDPRALRLADREPAPRGRAAARGCRGR